MLRRQFLKSSLAAGALQATIGAEAQVAGSGREYYHLRRYSLVRGVQDKLCAAYFAHALIPALNRLGITPVGVFSVDIGPEAPCLYLLMPSTDLSLLVNIQARLQKDDEFMNAAKPFWSAPAATPAYERVESSLLAAFPGWPKLTAPAPGKRIFQLRIYESPSDAAHVRKIEMFHSGEFEIFTRSGAKAVFYSDTLIGSRTPNLTYMLSFTDMAALDAAWDRFGADPEWKKLTSDPRFSYEEIVSKITNLILRPAEYSQI